MRAFSHEVHHVHQETHGNALNLFSPWNSVHFEFEVCHRDTRHFNSIYQVRVRTVRDGLDKFRLCALHHRSINQTMQFPRHTVSNEKCSDLIVFEHATMTSLHLRPRGMNIDHFV